MLARWVRGFATKRTIPYAVKNNWKLPIISTKGETPQSSGNFVEDGSWGSVTEVAPGETSINVPKDWRRLRTLSPWKRQMFALKEKFPKGWEPKRKLSREEMARLREIKTAQPKLSLNALGDMFRISPEAVRRIVKSKWRPNQQESMKLNERWTRRGIRLDSRMVKRPPGTGRPGAGTTRTGPPRRRNTGSTNKSRTKLHDPGQDIF